MDDFTPLWTFSEAVKPSLGLSLHPLFPRPLQVVLKSESRPTKPQGNHKVGRMSLSNPDKIARRAERKELKRQKRAKARLVASQQNSPSHSVPEKEAGSLRDLWKAVDTPARSDAGAFGLCSLCLDCVPLV